MAFIHGKGIKVFWGAYDVSNYFNEYSGDQSVDEVETTTFSATAKTYLIGFKDGSVSLKGFYDPTVTSGSDALLATALGNNTATNLSIFNGGATWAIGDRGVCATLKETKYNIKGSVSSAVGVEADGRADGGLDYGVCLHTSTTAETTSTNSASVDNGAATSNGFSAMLHATACAGTATIAIKGSTDNVTFGTTLTTFTGLTTVPTSENKTGTGTVPRYVRCESTLASVPSYNYAVLFARR